MKFDPVFHLLKWCALGGIYSGPIFQGIVSGKANGKHLSYAQVASILTNIFIMAGVVGAKPYTLRKSAIKWAARCGAREYEVRNASRHKDTARSSLFRTFELPEAVI